MRKYFTRTNMTNWKWWVALLLLVGLVLMLLPLLAIIVVVGIADIVIDFLENLITRIIDKLEVAVHNISAKVKEWVES